MIKVKEVLNVLKQPEVVATIAVGSAAVLAGKVLIDDYKAKTDNCTCECCCDETAEVPVADEDVAVEE